MHRLVEASIVSLMAGDVDVHILIVFFVSEEEMRRCVENMEAGKDVQNLAVYVRQKTNQRIVKNMVGVEDVKSPDVTKPQQQENLAYARNMAVDQDVLNLDAIKAPAAILISVQNTVADPGVYFRDAIKEQY